MDIIINDYVRMQAFKPNLNTFFQEIRRAKLEKNGQNRI